MPVTQNASYELDRPLEGFSGKGTLKTGYNGMSGVMPVGRALTYTTAQSASNVYPTLRVVNSSTDVLVGFSVQNRIGMPFIDPMLGAASELTTINPVTLEQGYPINAPIVYTDGSEYVYVICETAAKPGDTVHYRYTGGTAPYNVAGRVRNAAVANETAPATGWAFRETCLPGERVRIYKP